MARSARACRSKLKSQEQRPSTYRQPRETHQLQVDEFDSEMESVSEYTLFNVTFSNTPPIHSLEVDTGATMSLISQETYNRLCFHGNAPPVKQSLLKLRTYTGEIIEVVGEIEVNVSLNIKEYNLSLLVVKENGPNLLWRDLAL